MADREKLKPCPFCGYDATVKRALSGMYSCVICKACGGATGAFVKEERAIEAWNRRASDGC